MGIQAGSGVMADINITPLVDVMLVLLIIFMVAAPVMEKERSKRELEENRDKQQRLVALNLPALNNADASPAPVRTVTLHVSASLKVSLDDVLVADCSAHAEAVDKRLWQPCLDAVEGAVRDVKEAREGGVAVDADPVAKFGFVVGVMHRLHRANIERVSMFPRTTTG